MFCCQGFENLVKNAGQRGMSILIYQRADEFIFNLQARSISKDRENALSRSPIPQNAEGDTTISVNIGMNYCPFCGTDVQTLVNPATRSYFESLAEEHRKYDERPY